MEKEEKEKKEKDEEIRRNVGIVMSVTRAVSIIPATRSPA